MPGLLQISLWQWNVGPSGWRGSAFVPSRPLLLVRTTSFTLSRFTCHLSRMPSTWPEPC